MKEFKKKIKAFFAKIFAPIKKGWSKISPYLSKAWSVSLGPVFGAIGKGFRFIKKKISDFADWFSKKSNTPKFKSVMDKCTTGLLIFLMCSPVLILGYIFLWFILNIS